MERLFSSAFNIGELRCHKDDNFVDRMSRLYTLMIATSFAFLVTTKQYVGSPIHCWCPAQFTESHIDYTNEFCWISNTYYLPNERPIPGEKFSTKSMISYYQWVPIVLLLQGLLSLCPNLLWRFISKRSGINLSSIMDAAQITSQASYLEIREKAIRYIANQMDIYLLAQREYSTSCSVRMKKLISKLCWFVGGKEYGNYLITSYLLIKSLYFVNAIGQITILAMILDEDYHVYGLQVVEHLIRSRDWGLLRHFPRVTLCEFDIRDQSRVHSYVVQCVLSINLFNEKIFAFLWFWLIFIAIITIGDLMTWLFRSLYWPGQVQFIRKRLNTMDAKQRESCVMAQFTQNYLRRDGMLILRLIGMNMGDLVAAEIICRLWNSYSSDGQMMSKGNKRTTSKIYQNGHGYHLEMI